MAFSRFASAAGDEALAALARETFGNILRRRDDPKGPYSKVVPGARSLLALGTPMILANLVLEVEWLLDKAQAEKIVDDCLARIMGFFRDPGSGLLYEHVAPDGSHPDCFDGRLLNPGHGIEAMWFVIALARRRGDRATIARAVDSVLATLDLAWDRRYGGIFYFMDALGRPPQQLEWDRKLWWVHLEALVALAMGWVETGDRRCRSWFEKVHRYAWRHFPDPVHGEWFGYLDRRGAPFLDLKGGKWKGCFHLPRALLICARLLAPGPES